METLPPVLNVSLRGYTWWPLIYHIQHSRERKQDMTYNCHDGDLRMQLLISIYMRVRHKVHVKGCYICWNSQILLWRIEGPIPEVHGDAHCSKFQQNE